MFPGTDQLAQAAGVQSLHVHHPVVMPAFELRRALARSARSDSADSDPSSSVRVVRLPQRLRTPKEWRDFQGVDHLGAQPHSVKATDRPTVAKLQRLQGVARTLLVAKCITRNKDATSSCRSCTPNVWDHDPYHDLM